MCLLYIYYLTIVSFYSFLFDHKFLIDIFEPQGKLLDKKKKRTELSNFIWQLKTDGTKYEITWSILQHAPS